VPKEPLTGVNTNDDAWYKDAIIYEVHVRAYADSDADGRGDIAGLTSKLEYIKDLGVTAVWLLPFYKSPLKDDGYDIAEYTSVHEDYGTINDFKVLIEKAHRLGLKIITELVLNHTSDQHPWFQRSRTAPKGSYWHNFYTWSDAPDKYL
jgi:maltose alpha-D-glucosyltransferase/alpha-amylase